MDTDEIMAQGSRVLAQGSRVFQSITMIPMNGQFMRIGGGGARRRDVHSTLKCIT